MTKTQGYKAKFAQKGKIVKNKEYILIYSKDKVNFENNKFQPLYDKVEGCDVHYCYYVDNDLNVFNLIDLMKENNKLKQEISKIESIIPFNLKNLQMFMSLSHTIKNFIYSNAQNIYADSIVNIKREYKINNVFTSDIVTKIIINNNNYLIIKTGNGNLRRLISLQSTLYYTDDFHSEYSRANIRGDLWKGFNFDMGNINKEGNVIFKNGKNQYD